jgi:hypothetical protein
MKKFYILIVSIFCISILSAQTGIGTTTPNTSAKLDVYSTNKGFLPPRVTLTSATDGTTIASPAEGLLVYNLGSVGLQAGYYYWNGANWATIATATSAGNGVAAMDMVKLYGEAHSKASGKIGNSTTGFIFTVPVSGRYLFDFTSSATALNGGTNTIYFNVRQGTTVLASDNQSSYNNNVHVEYNGKVELNLQAGISYNLYNYATSGSFEANDYDRVYYKLVAGNLPVTGQSVDYVSVQASSDLGSITAGTAVKFNTTLGGNIPYDATTGQFTLSAGKTYRLTGMVTLGTQAAGTGTSAEANIVWRTGTAASGTNIGNYGQILSGNSTYNGNGQGVVDIIYTPTSNTTVLLYVNSIASTVSFRGGFTNAIIEQIGSSAIINPWVLSGNDVYNTTVEVGIGTSSPSASALLDLSSTSKGFLPPRMTTTQRNAISGATTGLVIYNTTINQLETYTGNSWSPLYSGYSLNYAQYRANAAQGSFTADVTKVNFPVMVSNFGSITTSSNNTFTLPANRVFRVDLNLGWKDGSWCRFGIYNSSSGTIISPTAHMEGGAASGSGSATHFIDTSSGTISIDVRLKAGGCSINDVNNGGTYATITIQSIY